MNFASTNRYICILKKHLNVYFVWAFICGIFLTVMIPALEFWPRIAHDEIQIIDFGRVILDPETRWGASWLLNSESPYMILSYPGVMLQEVAYRLFAPSNFGPRLSTLFGAIVASTLLLRYLIQRKTPKWVALALAIVFLADPIFNGSYRQGRLDSWSFVLIFLACVLLVKASRYDHINAIWKLLLTTIGFVATTSYFVWPSSLALFPLLALEFFYFIHNSNVSNSSTKLKYFAISGCWVLAGVVFAASLFALPIAVNWDLFQQSFDEGLRLQKTAANIQRSFFGMYVLYNPLILPACLVALFIKREIGLALAFAITLLMMYQTMIYPMRILYLLPYYILLIAGAFRTIYENPDIRWRHATLFVAFVTLVSWNSWVSFVQRPLVAYQVKKNNPIEEIQSNLESTIGPGNHRVLLVEWDMYFAARTLGWRYFKLFGSFKPQSIEYDSFLKSMDFVIIRDKFPFLKEVSTDHLETLGFRKRQFIEFHKQDYEGILPGVFKVIPTDMAYDSVIIYENPDRSLDPFPFELNK